MAAKKHQEGKVKCQNGELEEGLKLMRDAVDKQPYNATFRGHLAYWLLENNQFEEAKKESCAVLTTINPSYLMAYQVYQNAVTATGDILGLKDVIQKMDACPGRVTKSRLQIKDAERVLHVLEELVPKCESLVKERNFPEILKVGDEILKICPNSNNILMNKAYALFSLHRYPETVEICKRIQGYDKNFRILNFMAVAAYRSMKLPKAMEYLMKAIDLVDKNAPDHMELDQFRSVLMEIHVATKKVFTAMQSKDWETMRENAVAGRNLISYSHTNEMLKCQLLNFEAGALVQQKKLDEAYLIAKDILTSWDTNYEALSVMVDINIQVGKYQDALKDLEKLKQMKRGADDPMVERRILEAKTKEEELKHANAPEANSLNLYELLGLQLGAQNNEIRSQYRNLSRTFHPDKTRHLPDVEQKEANSKLTKIQFAYRILGDPVRKSIYDKGQQAIVDRKKTEEKHPLLLKLEENRRKYPIVFGLAPAISSSSTVQVQAVASRPNRRAAPTSTVLKRKKITGEENIVPSRKKLR